MLLWYIKVSMDLIAGFHFLTSECDRLIEFLSGRQNYS